MQSQRIDEMKVFGGTLIARVMESDTELELLTTFVLSMLVQLTKYFQVFQRKFIQ